MEHEQTALAAPPASPDYQRHVDLVKACLEMYESAKRLVPNRLGDEKFRREEWRRFENGWIKAGHFGIELRSIEFENVRVVNE